MYTWGEFVIVKVIVVRQTPFVSRVFFAPTKVVDAGIRRRRKSPLMSEDCVACQTRRQCSDVDSKDQSGTITSDVAKEERACRTVYSAIGLSAKNANLQGKGSPTISMSDGRSCGRGFFLLVELSGWMRQCLLISSSLQATSGLRWVQSSRHSVGKRRPAASLK